MLSMSGTTAASWNRSGCVVAGGLLLRPCGRKGGEAFRWLQRATTGTFRRRVGITDALKHLKFSTTVIAMVFKNWHRFSLKPW